MTSAWLKRGGLVLEVPSALSPENRNYLLNAEKLGGPRRSQRVPDLQNEFDVRGPYPFQFDPRFFFTIVEPIAPPEP